MVKLSYDLHIHSCLSPCCDDESLPEDIVGMAIVNELDVIAVTDHNSCKNLPEVFRVAAEYGLLVIPGMELTTSEEVHVLCFFENLDNALWFSGYVRNTLIIPNDTEIFGNQFVINHGERVSQEKFMLSQASGIAFDEIYDLITPQGGVMVPAHIERSSHGILAQMGFVPEDSKFKTFEMKHTGFMEEILKNNPYLKNCNCITDSDAHHLGLINTNVNFMEVQDKSISSFLNFLRGSTQ